MATTQAEKAVSLDDIEKQFKEYSVAEFFKKNRQMLGYSGEVRSLTTIVHEYVTNSLDSCEDAKTLPEITVQIDALAATQRTTLLGIGDGIVSNFDVDDEIGKAATLSILVDGLEKTRGTDYVIKFERKGKQSVRQLVFKNAPPQSGSKVEAKWAAGHLKVIVQDNGTGIPKSKIGNALGELLSGTKFAQRAQKRGQQGIGACMRSDTLVPLADGRILPIKEIVECNMIGEKILALDLKTLKIIPAEISSCIKVRNPHFVRVRTQKGREIFLTPENPVLTVNSGKPEWIRADAVKVGERIAAPIILKKFENSVRQSVLSLVEDDSLQVDDYHLTQEVYFALHKKFGSMSKISLATGINKDVLRNWFRRKMPNGKPRGRPSVRNLVRLAEKAGINPEAMRSNILRVGRRGTFIRIPQVVDWDIFWLAGFLAGDGHITRKEDNKWGTSISVTGNDKQLIDKFCSKMSDLFGLSYSVLYNEKKHYYFAQTSSEVIAQLFGQFGIKRGKKFDSFDLPNLVMSSDDELLSYYLKGIFDAEGSISPRIRAVSLMIHNKKALDKISLALLRLGIVSSLNKCNKHWRIMICGKDNLERFVQKIGFSSPEKNQLLHKIISTIKKSYAPTEVIPGMEQLVSRIVADNDLKASDFPTAAKSAIKTGVITKLVMKQISSATTNQLAVSELTPWFETEVDWLRVEEIELVDNPESFVYDLEVESHHNFVAGGIIAHNSYATLFSLITTGKAIHVKSCIGEHKVYECDLTIDVKKNHPVVSNEKELSQNFKGLRIEAEFAEVAYDRSEYGVYEYLRRTAIANPHAQITFIDPNKELTVFPRASSMIPPKPKSAPPHPLGLTTSDLMDMAAVTSARKVSSFLTGDFAKFSNEKISELKTLLPSIDLEKHPSKLQWQEAEAIVHAFQKIKFFNPDLDTLQPIGEEQVTKSLKNLLQPECFKVVERKPKVFRGGIPFMVEAAIAYGGKAGVQEDGKIKGETMRFANRVPLLFDAGNCAITEAVKTVEWNRYDLKNWEDMPVSIFINFTSVYVPYTGAGKLAISSEEEIVAEIRMALMECGREVSTYLHGLQKAELQEERKKIFSKYLGEVAEALQDVTGREKSVLLIKLKKMAEERTTMMLEEENEDDAELDKLEKGALEDE